MKRAMASTQLLLAQRPTLNSRRQFHNPLVTQQHRRQTSKPSRPIADFCSVTTRPHQKSKKASSRSLEPIFGTVAAGLRWRKEPIWEISKNSRVGPWRGLTRATREADQQNITRDSQNDKRVRIAETMGWS
ncbi:MAG: hypothetical protein ACLQM8_24995 [Limisphaerales bacterium]